MSRRRLGRDGRPIGKRAGNGSLPRALEEAKVLVTGPLLLIRMMSERATQRGITVREAWRRAGRTWLGLPEVPPEDVSRD